MTSQWREEEFRYYRDRTIQEPARHRSRSPAASSRRGSGGYKHRPTYEGGEESGHSSRKHKRHSYETAERDRDYYREQSRDEGYHKIRASEGGLDRRSREQHSPSFRSSRRHHSISSNSRHRHRDYDQRHERSPRHHSQAISPVVRYPERHPPSRSPRRAYSPREEYYERPGYHSREPYSSSHRRRRSRSPRALDYYSHESSYRTRHSPERHHRHRSGAHDTRHHDWDERPSSRRSRSRSTHQAQSPTIHQEKPSKSSRRSEKQKQRSLRHLREKTQADNFLRQLSVSPGPWERTQERDSMQQSTRPIQSILDDPSRESSPPRPIPSFDVGNTGPSHGQEPYPMHGIKSNDVHPSHRRGPPHVDTRQHYHTSPQYTPNSSYHGSPTHSGSPYSQGRGGWGGQYYMGQHGYVQAQQFLA